MKKKVLIVDDEEDILTSVAMLINNMGYEAKTVNSGEKALEIIKKQKFDLILLDILMPGISGREVLEKIREYPKLKNQKVAFLTVVKLSEYGKDMMEKKLKPVDYFQKPINVSDFKRRIKKILE